MSNYTYSDVLVGTDWVANHMDDSQIRLIEVDVDTTAYDAGHIKNSLGFSWDVDLNDSVRRDILSKEDFEKLLSAAGIANSDTVVLYGDNNNWFAAYAFWIFKIYGHETVRLMNGGRKKWIDETRELTTAVESISPTSYRVAQMNDEIRTFLPEVLDISQNGGAQLVDVRSADEFTGKIIAPPNMNESAQRGGHIPGARNVPWAKAVAEDGTFKSAPELERLYVQEQNLDKATKTIAYCRIGERSSHTWFVLKYLLGFHNVKNYDGSWTEYGNLVATPIAR